jgi:hypothetical protein
MQVKILFFLYAVLAFGLFCCNKHGNKRNIKKILSYELGFSTPDSIGVNGELYTSASFKTVSFVDSIKIFRNPLYNSVEDSNNIIISKTIEHELFVVNGKEAYHLPNEKLDTYTKVTNVDSIINKRLGNFYNNLDILRGISPNNYVVFDTLPNLRILKYLVPDKTNDSMYVYLTRPYTKQPVSMGASAEKVFEGNVVKIRAFLNCVKKPGVPATFYENVLTLLPIDNDKEVDALMMKKLKLLALHQ